ncbi:MAG TPA: trypsin-like peptidase domain-containing protein [Pyrinomonadaceae bacterium]|nr:trypsin-like peptidase domain-containing protein [Pyrinomonadaceae bacterium]
MPRIQLRRAISFTVLFFAASLFPVAAQQDVPPSFAAIAERAEPFVVSIEAKGRAAAAIPPSAGKPDADDDVLDFLRRQAPQRPVYHVGSGFIVDKAGYIVTNNHVVSESARLTVKLDTGEEFTARVIGVDDETDLAVLKIDAGRDLPAAKFGDSDKMKVGDWVLAIGSPFGLAKSVSAGIISQTQRDTPGASAFQRFIQTDAVINPGNSGGPLVNMQGEVIGVNSQIATQTGEFSGVGFALPSHEAARVYEQIVANGKVSRGYLGAYLDSVKSEFAQVYGLGDLRGAFITDIRDKSGPASVAGLKTGDIIVVFNGTAIKSAQDLIDKVASTPPDRTVAIEYLREVGEKLEKKVVNVKLGERPSVSAAIGDNDGKVLPVDGRAVPNKPFGLTLSTVAAAGEKYKVFEGNPGLVVTDIDPDSYITDVQGAARVQALSRGDLIQKINRFPVANAAAFASFVSKLKVGDPVVLQILVYNPALKRMQTGLVQFTVK